MLRVTGESALVKISVAVIAISDPSVRSQNYRSDPGVTFSAHDRTTLFEYVKTDERVNNQ